MKKSKEYKVTPEELLAKKTAKRNELKRKWENNIAYIALQQGYADAAEEEYRKRDAQVELMQKRIADGKAAREEADALRGPFQKLIETTTPEEKRSESYQSTLARIVELDTFYHETTQDVSRIYNGFTD